MKRKELCKLGTVGIFHFIESFPQSLGMGQECLEVSVCAKISEKMK